MHIIQITSEIAPAAKVGGLADVVLGFSRELLKQGHKVEVLLPYYRCLQQKEIQGCKRLCTELPCAFDGRACTVSVWQGLVREVPVTFIGAPDHTHFLKQEQIYGGKEEVPRFLFFCRAALEWLHKQQTFPDILHSHDWPAAAVNLLARKLLPLQTCKLFFTIHNIDYQGRCSIEDLNRIGLQGSLYLQPDRLQDNQWDEAINLMKGGIVYSDAFNTVSPTYAEEIQTAKEGRGLETTIQRYKEKFSGILNGIDYDYWNPATDRYLDIHYSAKDLKTGNWEGKQSAKKALQRQLGLPTVQKPLVACIARLVPQKGIDLIKHGAYRTNELGGQFVLLGSSSDAKIQKSFEILGDLYAKEDNVRFCLQTSEKLAHQIFAGADMLFVPSLFEPCGLTQMIALRYGALPLARRVGGLADTVHDIETSYRPSSERNGFTFIHPDSGGVNWALDRAIFMWKTEKERWQKLVAIGMQQDHSWRRSTREYLEQYRTCSRHLMPIPTINS